MATNTGTVTTTNIGTIIPVTSSFVEGQSTVRPQLFNGNNYAYWACRMKIYLQSIGLDTWNITQTEYSEPTTDFSQWTAEQKTVAQNNSKAMNICFVHLIEMNLIECQFVSLHMKSGKLCKLLMKEKAKLNRPKFPCSQISFNYLK